MISATFVKITMLVLAVFCMFTISNYILGIPKWYAPNMYLIEESKGIIFDYSELWSTGFSWSRSGWGITLALYIPFCLMLTNVDSIKKTSIYCLCIIILSMFLCGCRNAILASIVSCLVIFKYLYLQYKYYYQLL